MSRELSGLVADAESADQPACLSLLIGWRRRVGKPRYGRLEPCATTLRPVVKHIPRETQRNGKANATQQRTPPDGDRPARAPALATSRLALWPVHRILDQGGASHRCRAKWACRPVYDQRTARKGWFARTFRSGCARPVDRHDCMEANKMEASHNPQKEWRPNDNTGGSPGPDARQVTSPGPGGAELKAEG